VRFGGDRFAIIKRRRRIVSFCRARRRRRSRRIFSFCRTPEEEEFSAFVELEEEEAAEVKKAAKSGIFSLRTSAKLVLVLMLRSLIMLRRR
jgi:preprotein translocase subunit Sss1